MLRAKGQVDDDHRKACGRRECIYFHVSKRREENENVQQRRLSLSLAVAW